MESSSDKKNTILIMGLWLVTVVLGFFAFVATPELVERNFLRFFPEQAEAAANGEGALFFLSSMTYFTLGLVMVALIIGGFEYYRNKKNQARSWKFLSRTIAAELAILALALFI